MTGFERYLLENEFILITPYKEFSSYDCVARTYERNKKMISVGLMGSPSRIGIRFPPTGSLVTTDDNGEIIIVKEITEKYTYLPTPDQYKEWEKVLTQI